MKEGSSRQRQPRRYKTWFRHAATMLFIAPAFYLSSHVVKPENFHPAVESYRRSTFILNLNPVRWEVVQSDIERIAVELESISPERAGQFRSGIRAYMMAATGSVGDVPPTPGARRAAAREVFELCTRAMAELLDARLEELKKQAFVGNREASTRLFEESRQFWEAFEYEAKFSDKELFREIGLCYLEMSTALGNDALMGEGEVSMDSERVSAECDEIIEYIDACYKNYESIDGRALAPLPVASKTCDASAVIPPKLPPGSNINKQRPRPRQVLNMVSRGVDETDTPLIAFGDMAFDSSFIFGEPAFSLGISCNNCHNKSITNPNFTIPGLSSVAGGMDVSGNFFGPHANNGHFDPLDIPDLRGIRFTGPYGRNGRMASLREFTRNVIVNEFNGPEPDPIVVDAMVAYMMEFDFLPNPLLSPDGTLTSEAPEAALRGEDLFHKPFVQMNNASCATCHVPSTNFVDGQRHNIGSVAGAEEHSLDRSLDTPTLLSAKFTQPYFHDGSLATFEDVVRWFDARYELKLGAGEVRDLVAYLDAVGGGVDPYEEDPDAASPGEVQEQYFFMASWEYLRDKQKPELARLLFSTIAQELRNEKWGLKYGEATDVAEKMAQLADDATAALDAGELEVVNARVVEFRRVYEENAALIAGENLLTQGESIGRPAAKLSAMERDNIVEYAKAGK